MKKNRAHLSDELQTKEQNVDPCVPYDSMSLVCAVGIAVRQVCLEVAVCRHLCIRNSGYEPRSHFNDHFFLCIYHLFSAAMPVTMIQDHSSCGSQKSMMLPAVQRGFGPWSARQTCLA